MRRQCVPHEHAAAVQADVAQTRSDQCKKAQDAYDQSVQARRIYRTNANGEREYLSDDEAEKARVNAKLAVDTANLIRNTLERGLQCQPDPEGESEGNERQRRQQ